MSQHVENSEMSGNAARGLSRQGVKGIWQHTRRVPKRYAHLDRRKMIRTSLHTQDYHLAIAKASQIELLQNEEWELAIHSRPSPEAWDLKADRLKQIVELRGFTYLSAMWNTLAKLKGWPLQNPFSGLAFAENEKRRHAFSSKWIKERLLTPESLKNLNSKARTVLLLMVNTGARPSELVNLKPNRICLHHEIPHIQVRADERQLKTK